MEIGENHLKMVIFRCHLLTPKGLAPQFPFGEDWLGTEGMDPISATNWPGFWGDPVDENPQGIIWWCNPSFMIYQPRFTKSLKSLIHSFLHDGVICMKLQFRYTN